MDTKRTLGIGTASTPEEQERDMRYINLKLAVMGQPIYEKQEFQVLSIAHDLIENFREKNRLLSNYLCPADQRIQKFINDYFHDEIQDLDLNIPTNSFILDRYGLARQMSLPPDQDYYEADIIKSYRIKQGVLHNPKHDRRTTKDVFHVADGGLPVPADKKEVPKSAYAKMLAIALSPSERLLETPYTSTQERKAKAFISLLLRPLVCPEIPGNSPAKSMEVRFFAPGNLISNLDFVESIFGNAGDPFLPENDAGLDIEHWTGHTGCVLLAPQILGLKKVDLGLPHKKYATARQIKDGMCWEEENEIYNDGLPFKITCRDERGIMITLLTDNYYGYCKKEVKTQISFSANLYGLCEEEHAGGALVFPSYSLGDHFIPDSFIKSDGHSLATVQEALGDKISILPEGYGTDNNYENIFYLPEDVHIDINTQLATWRKDGKKQELRVIPNNTYIYPTGYKIRLEKHPGSPSWRLVGTLPEGVLCHKPCTVSGGGKSEISKSIWDAIHFGPIFINNFQEDMDKIQSILDSDYSNRYINPPDKGNHVSKTILSPDRSLGSVIKMFASTRLFTDEYNNFINEIPNRIKSLLFLIKRFYRQEWGTNWREFFSVDIINGEPGHEFKFANRKLVGSYLRVGLKADEAWWTCKLRQDFMPSEKVQWEDDISASVVVPTIWLENIDKKYNSDSLKLVSNCEFRFFQRPDEAINRGYDKQAESDLAEKDNFISNFEPLKKENAVELVEKAISFHSFSDPMKRVITDVANSEHDGYFISSSHPRIVDGKPSKNPRYLQKRPDLVDGSDLYLANVGTRCHRKMKCKAPISFPVNSVLCGRRNNPAEKTRGIRALSVYGPIHYQELPELFMDFICSLTGKSPSTTGAGSEGALTKGPFNALVPTADLNNALLSFILTGYSGYTTAAGYVGPRYRVAHDISLLIPELWCRLSEAERQPSFLIENGFLEKVNDFEYKGRTILAGRLGYRITKEFVAGFFGRMFDNPNTVFNTEMLKPEVQDLEEFADGVDNITEAHERLAKTYLEDGSIESAIEPLKAIINIMATGKYNGHDINSEEVRSLFRIDNVLNSSWYQERLQIKQSRDASRYQSLIKYLEYFMSLKSHEDEVERLQIRNRLRKVQDKLVAINKPEYIDRLRGTIGADPLCKRR